MRGAIAMLWPWNQAVTDPLTEFGDFPFGVEVRQGQVVLRQATTCTREPLALAGEDLGGYNGPAPDGLYQSSNQFHVNQRVYAPGSVVTASLDPGVVFVSCSMADPDNITVDGALIPRAQVHGDIGYLYWWYGLAPMPVILAPVYGVNVDPNQAHTVQFKLDPAYSNQYFEFTTEPPLGSWVGPYVNCNGFN